MIDKLRKKLTLIFVISMMLLFTITFCVIIKKDIKNEKDAKYEYFRVIATDVLFSLNPDHIDNRYFSFYEQAENVAFQMENNNNQIVYQTDPADFADLSAIVNILKTESEKMLAEPLIDIKISSSGIFPCTVHGTRYMGVFCGVTSSAREHYTLYIIGRDNSFANFIAKNVKIYIFIWTAMLIATIFISHILMKKASKPTETALQSQKDFIAFASHELKAPLAVIMANAEAVITEPGLDEHILHHMNTIDSEVSRMSGLVQDLLLLSSLDANTWQLNKDSIDICTLMLTLYEKFEPLCQKKNMRIELNLVNDVFPEFIADENRLEQILGIFLDNAIHYSHAGTSISFSVHSETKWIVFTIQDHGVGINNTDKAFIYDRFYQADKSHSNTQHYGLGLSIAKELVEIHKGKIELFDTPGGGCTFKVYFPLLYLYSGI